MLRRALILAGLPSLAFAQGTGTLPERLYIDPGTLLGSSRVVSLGGAYVGVAEGADGMTSNLAAVAHRDPKLDRPWDFDATLSWINIQLGNPRKFDFDNSGTANGAASTSQLLGALMLQFGGWGLGTSFRVSSYTYCTTDCQAADVVGVQLIRAVVAAGVAFHHDDLLVAFGFYGTSASLSYQGQTWQFSGNGIELDALYRPLGAAYRLGLSIRPEVVGAYTPQAGQSPVIAGQQLYSATVSPSLLSIGASYRLGEGANRYNRLSPAAARESPETPTTAAAEGPPGRWLLTAQLDLLQGVEDAVPLRAQFNQTPTAVAQSGALEPRLGVENETLVRRLRTRLGTYLEPSEYPGVNVRPHITGGAEVRLFHLVEDWTVGASFDFAHLYYNVGLAVGWWQ